MGNVVEFKKPDKAAIARKRKQAYMIQAEHLRMGMVMMDDALGLFMGRTDPTCERITELLHEAIQLGEEDRIGEHLWTD